MKSGILLLDKPIGLTSNAALSRAKRLLGIRKAGHTGALDPLATGLLPLCFGEATKVSAFLLDADKRYRAEILLGAETASGDAEGEVTRTAPVPELDRDALERILDRFRGPIDQVPPMYSALKHEGRRLHELARAGIEVERKARRVTIGRLEVLAHEGDRLSIGVDCTKGTYIRSLAMDIGAAIGCGGHLTALRREASGLFQLDDAVTLDSLEELDSDAARALLIPADAALSDLPAVRVDESAEADLRLGRAVDCAAEPSECVRIYAGECFVGLGAVGAGGVLQPRRLFHPDTD